MIIIASDVGQHNKVIFLSVPFRLYCIKDEAKDNTEGSSTFTNVHLKVKDEIDCSSETFCV